MTDSLKVTEPLFAVSVSLAACTTTSSLKVIELPEPVVVRLALRLMLPLEPEL